MFVLVVVVALVRGPRAQRVVGLDLDPLRSRTRARLSSCARSARAARGGARFDIVVLHVICHGVCASRVFLCFRLCGCAFVVTLHC